MEKLLSKLDVMQLVGVSGVTLWLWVRQGRFPKPRRLQPNKRYGKIVWFGSEIEEWIKKMELVDWKDMPAVTPEANEPKKKRVRKG